MTVDPPTPRDIARLPKRLSAMDLLVGQTETITLSDFRTRPGDVIAQVQLGKVFTLTKGGRPVATLQRPEPTAAELGAALRRIDAAARLKAAADRATPREQP